MVLLLFRYRIGFLLVLAFFVSFTNHMLARINTLDAFQQLDLAQSHVRNLPSQALDSEHHFLGNWFGRRT